MSPRITAETWLLCKSEKVLFYENKIQFLGFVISTQGIPFSNHVIHKNLDPIFSKSEIG